MQNLRFTEVSGLGNQHHKMQNYASDKLGEFCDRAFNVPD